MLWAAVAFLVWNMIAGRFLPPPKTPDRTTTQPTTMPVAAPTAEGTAQTQPGVPPPESGGLHAVGAEAAETLSLGSIRNGGDSPYRMHLELNARGASVSRATLTDYAEDVDSPERYRLLDPVESEGDENSHSTPFYSFAVEKINIGGMDVPLANVNWKASEGHDESAETATFEADVLDANDNPILRLLRVYRLPRQPIDEQRHDAGVELQIQNLTDQPQDVRVTERGPVGIRQAYSRADTRHVFNAAAAPGDGQSVSVSGTAFKKAAAKTQPLVDRESPEKLWWTGTGNKYFSAIVVPLSADGQVQPGYVDQVDAVDLDGEPGTVDDVTCRLVSHFHVPPHDSRTDRWQCYLGPNDKHAFTRASNEDYVRWGFPRIITLGYGSCAFNWLTDAMVAFLDGLERVFGNYGVAIIVLVLVVRALLHPITKRGQINMVRMQERMGSLQPKIERLKEKFGNDKARLQQEQMKLYKEEGVNPATSMFSSCLPMAIQMPIWIALYTSLSNNIAMRHRGFVLWINDLTAPDALIQFSRGHTIPVISHLTGEIHAFNLLPILLAITMILQQKLMPKAQPPKSSGTGGSGPQMDQAAQMQKMMPLMSVFFAFILYSMPSGLNLYIMASSLFGTIEQWRIRKHIKEVKAKGESLAPRSRRGDDKSRKPSWFMRRIHALQKRAEDAQRVQSSRKR